MTRTIVLAAPRSFCAGVERAIEIVERLLAARPGPIYVRKQIVHNTSVVEHLQTRGAIFVDELDEVPEGSTVVFSAHGVAPAVHTAAEQRGLDVVDATCPLVTKVHQEARRYAARGHTVVLIGHAGHEEVEGTLGEAPEQTVQVSELAEVDELEVDGPISYLTQTTLAVDETTALIDALRNKFPGARGPDTADICYATTNRQAAVATIAEQAELVIVVGSANSSNSRRLVEVAQRTGTTAYLVDRATDVPVEWLEGVSVVGLTAGASAPPALVHAVIERIAELGPIRIVEHEVTRETLRFTLPPEVRH
ncbi:4-hydroxy-3-methylbut-2-enyl diphosphate reductase [Kribbella sp. NPDC026611]|uniref:4-hydroxy-3-methylbut-2-enyl diphosphate reductase n=1 Tax=Kribbella sp. NPDC026611 TaxID=3154911 RepID=UPI0033CF3DB3